MIKPAEFIHPEDAAALRQLESIPGFPTIAKKVLELGYEKLRYGINMASTIRLSPTQLPELYRHLPPICERLGIKEPEFYLEMNPVPNAYTSGDTRVFIVVTSGLVEMMDDEELDAILAHECGRILCRPVPSRTRILAFAAMLYTRWWLTIWRWDSMLWASWAHLLNRWNMLCCIGAARRNSRVTDVEASSPHPMWWHAPWHGWLAARGLSRKTSTCRNGQSRPTNTRR